VEKSAGAMCKNRRPRQKNFAIRKFLHQKLCTS